jgi:RimJ/RimL family protein N-acetyltransferase
MIIKSIIVGKNIKLRSVKVEDSNFILSLRLNPDLNKHLNPTSPDLEAQKIWIEQQIKRELDYYFIIESLDGIPLGTISVYDINTKQKSFNWGRWIILKKAPSYVAVESTILVYNFAFNVLNLQKAISEVRIENKNVIRFHLSYGSEIFKIDEQNIYYTFSSNSFPKLLKMFRNMHLIEIK